jgi:hypothetical protein
MRRVACFAPSDHAAKRPDGRASIPGEPLTKADLYLPALPAQAGIQVSKTGFRIPAFVTKTTNGLHQDVMQVSA